MNTKKDELLQSLFLYSWAGIVARSCLWSMACCPKLSKEFLIAKFSTGPQLLRVFLTSPSLFQIQASLGLSIWILEPSTGTGCLRTCYTGASPSPGSRRVACPLCHSHSGCLGAARCPGSSRHSSPSQPGWRTTRTGSKTCCVGNSSSQTSCALLVS